MKRTHALIPLVFTLLLAACGVGFGQELVRIGPATQLQEVITAPPFPVPAYKVQPQGCFEYLAFLTDDAGKYGGDEFRMEDGTKVSRSCYTVEIEPDTISTFIFQLTNNIRTHEFIQMQLNNESTAPNRTVQYWATDTSLFRYFVFYMPYEEGLIVAVDKFDHTESKD